MNPYRHIFGALADAEVDYVIVGGVAMNLLGYPRFTGDIDVLIALDLPNLARMSSLMKKLGYEQRIPVALEELGDEKKALSLMKEKNLIAYAFHNPAFPQFGIDVIVGESIRFSAYKEHCVSVKAWDISVPVVSIDDLIEMKKQSNRKKDIEDIQALLELKGL